ncbi:MAG: decaprenyl-phosphate phosphoribosyltransferase [Candidatus Latescibacterota bacterium]
MLYQLLVSMRPRQWVKNTFVLPAVVFSRHLFEWPYLGRSLAGLACFCLLSGAVYLINDVADRAQDRLHPQKARRPIAAGLVPPSLAILVAAGLFALGLSSAYLLQPHFGFIALLFAALNLAYSCILKHVVLVDVLAVATGFLLRALGGAVVIQVPISTWFILCSFMLALFLAVVKRRQELVLLDRGAGRHRAILDDYSVSFLDQFISILTSATLVCYALYAMDVGGSSADGQQMGWTLPFVLYGILRYLYVVYRQGAGDNPTAVVWRDRPLQVNLLLWLATSVLIYYGL